MAGVDLDKALQYWGEVHRIATDMQQAGTLAPADARTPDQLLGNTDDARAAAA